MALCGWSADVCSADPGASGYAIISGMQIVQKSSAPPPVAGPLLDIDFGVGTSSAKAGFAATGQSATDLDRKSVVEGKSGGRGSGGEVQKTKEADHRVP